MKVTLFILIFLALAHQTFAANDVIVKNLKIYVNCTEFFIKSFSYIPTPIGRSIAASNYRGGLCSWRINAFGVNESACQDKDFIDGSAGPGILKNGWFRDLWTRDLPVMKQAGANTIRVHNANPWTKNYTATHIGNDGILLPNGKSHREFMDVAQSYSLKVIFPLPGEWSWLINYPQDEMYQLIENIVDEVGNHPALLMWMIGDDLPFDISLIAIVNKYIAYARYYTYEKWGRVIPVTTAVTDAPQGYDFMAQYLNVDVFSANAGFRGLGWSNLWTGDPSQQFSGWKILCGLYNKPLFISEMGWYSANNEITTQIPNWVNQKIASLYQQVENGCCGWSFYEFGDDISNTDPTKQTLGVVGYTVTVVGNKNSTQENVFAADNLYKKAIFAAISNGTYNGTNYNMNANVFSLLGRSASVLSADACVPVIPSAPSNETIPLPTKATTTGTTTAAVTTTAGSGIDNANSTTTGEATTGTKHTDTAKTTTTGGFNLATSASEKITVSVLFFTLFVLLL